MERTAYQNMEFLPFEEARAFARSLGLKKRDEGWHKWAASENRPKNIPSSPHRIYKNKGWKDYGDWLGTYTKSTKNRTFLTFEEAKRIVHPLEFKSQDEYNIWFKSEGKGKDIPAHPYETYVAEWKGWPDFLGYEETDWSIRRVKELLCDLIKSRIIYQWNEAVLYSFLLRRGVLNIQGRHTQFFKNLIEASRTDEGRKAIEKYANSDSEIPPDLSKFKEIGEGIEEQEIESASSQELSTLVENTDPLDYGEIKTAEQILAQTNVLESINVDEEAMQFYVDYSIDELWKSAFKDKENAVFAAKHEGKNGNKYHDRVVETFLSDYEGTQNIKIPQGFAFPYPPTLMQLYVAYKVKTNQYFGNFSGTGAGKTLSAVLASHVIDIV